VVLYSTPPFSFTVCCFIKHRDNITFYFSHFIFMYTASCDYVTSTWQISLSQIPCLHILDSHFSRRSYLHTYGPHLFNLQMTVLSCSVCLSSAELRAMNSLFTGKAEYVVSFICAFSFSLCCQFLRPVFGSRLITDSYQVVVQSVPLPLHTAPVLTC
jgi:hypothetical protein